MTTRAEVRRDLLRKSHLAAMIRDQITNPALLTSLYHNNFTSQSKISPKMKQYGVIKRTSAAAKPSEIVRRSISQAMDPDFNIREIL